MMSNKTFSHRIKFENTNVASCLKRRYLHVEWAKELVETKPELKEESITNLDSAMSERHSSYSLNTSTALCLIDE